MPLTPHPQASSPKQPRRWLYIGLGLLSSAAFMLLAAGRLELVEIERAFRAARLWPWLPLGIISYLIGHWVRGVRCRYLVSHEAQLSTLTATNVVVVGYAINNILPARLGEFGRAAMLSQCTGLPFVQGLSLTFLERILDGLVMLALLALALVSLDGALQHHWLSATLEAASFIFLGVFCAVFIAILMPHLLLRWASRLLSFLPEKLHDTLVRSVDQALRGIQYLRSPRAALQISALSVLVWLFEAGLFLSLLPAFGLEPDPVVALLAMTVTNLGILVPSSPGFIGPFHFFCMRALSVVGVSGATGFSYAALVHLAFYIPITAWGVIILFSYGFKLSDAIESRNNALPLRLLGGQSFQPQNQARDPLPSPTTLALCEAFLPEGALSEEKYERVLLACARFVEGQLQALPFRLKFLYGCGILGFRVLTWLRFARGFPHLKISTRKRWLALWAFGPLSLTRQLFRAPRATALVAYYEHPEVIALTRGTGPQPSSSPGNVIPLRPKKQLHG